MAISNTILTCFGQFAEGRLISDPKIDQLVDLDGFAAQIAALDTIVSISNTTIDMAGMLGVPTLHIRDDKGSAIWPASGQSKAPKTSSSCMRGLVM
jgi:hypothetical protein